MGSGGSKGRPGRHSSCCCCSKASALTSGKVGEGARGGRDAFWDLAAASWVSTPISSQPASPIASTCHSQLDSCFLKLKLGGGARGEHRRGGCHGHVGEAKEGKGGQLFPGRAQFCSPMCVHLALHCTFPLALRRGTLQHLHRVRKAIPLAQASHLQKPDP